MATSTQKTGLSLLDMPPEIRNQISEYVLTSSTGTLEFKPSENDACATSKAPPIPEYTEYPGPPHSAPDKLTPSLLYTCKQLFSEGQMFWSLNNFIFDAGSEKLSAQLCRLALANRPIQEASLRVPLYCMAGKYLAVEHFFKWCRERKLKKAVVMVDVDPLMHEDFQMEHIESLVKSWKDAANSSMDLPAVETTITYPGTYRERPRSRYAPEWVAACKTMDELVRKFDNPDERASTSDDDDDQDDQDDQDEEETSDNDAISDEDTTL